MLTLLRVWTDTRDAFTESSFDKLCNIFMSDTLAEQAKKDQQLKRLFPIYDNMIDILRKVKVSTEKF
jgi:hypothetical protein